MAVGNGVNSGNLWKLGYEYGEIDGNGNVDTAKNTGNVARQTLSFNGLTHPFVQTYKYDSLYRLTEARETSNGTQTWKQNFSYDRYGNRLTHDKFSGTNLVTQTNITHPAIDPNTNRFASGQGYLFDKNGNLTTDAENRAFVFNGDNKQKEIRDASNNLVGEYFYDGEGKRVKKKSYQGGVLDEETVFVYSSGKLIAEYSSKPPAQNPTTSFTITDQLGSPRVLVNTLGQVISRRDFMPFGEELDADETYRKTLQKYGQTDSVRQKFTGYERDNESELDFAQARMYNPAHGRFTAVDPLLASGMPGNPQTWNRYTYVLNNPLIFVDPTGLIWGINSDNQVRWFDDKLGKGFSEFTPDAWQYQSNGRTVQLDANSSNWNYINPVEVVAESNPIQDLVQATGLPLGDSIAGMQIGARNTVTGAVNAVTQPLGPGGAALGIPNPLEIAALQPDNARQAAYALITETAITSAAGAGVGAALAGPASAGSALRVTPSGFTRSYAGLGQRMHAEFMVDQQVPGLAIKEFRLPSGKRIDFLDIANSTIYELKPFNPNLFAAGRTQLQIYKTELEAMPRFQEVQWKTVLRTY